MVRRAEGRRLALAIDDAHLLDPASATLVHQVAADGTACVLVTVRSRDAVPDPILALWKDGPGDYVEVQPLAQHEVEGLVERVLGGNVDGASLHKLWNATRGNVFNQGYMSAFPDARIEVTLMIAQGDYVVAHYNASGTHTEPLRMSGGNSVAATGKKFAVKRCSTYELQGGKILRQWDFADMISLFSQLGLTSHL
jgi:predicted ester cyclase